MMTFAGTSDAHGVQTIRGLFLFLSKYLPSAQFDMLKSKPSAMSTGFVSCGSGWVRREEVEV